jgi:transketolase
MLNYEKVLLDTARRDPRLYVMTAEKRRQVSYRGPVLGDRFIDTGITEQTLVGMAAGLALRGKRPVIHGLAAFLTMRAFEFIRTDVGIAQLPVKLVGFVPGVLSDANGPTHQALEDIALMRGIPGMQVFSPADADDLVAGLPQVLSSDQPTYIRWTNLPAVHRHDHFALGQAECLELGTDVHILSHGALYGQAYAAYGLLKRAGLHAGITNLRTVEPLDEAHVLECAARSRLLVTVEDHFQRGGLPSILGELFLREGVSPRRILNFGFRTWFRPGTLPAVLENEGLTGPQIAARIQSLLL